MARTLPIADLAVSLWLPERGLGVDFLGPTLRGLIGYGLREVACTHGSDAHGRCPCPARCDYAHLFEGTPPASGPAGYSAVPQPFRLIVDAPGAPRDPSGVHFTVRLFGRRAIALAPRVIDAIDARSAHGIGSREAPFHIANATLGRTRTIAMAPTAGTNPATRAARPTRLEVRFTTPCMLRKCQRARDGALPTANDFVHAGRTRAWLLAVCYADPNSGAALEQPPPPDAHLGGFTLASTNTDLTAWRIRRQSGRQHRAIDLDGVIGNCAIEGDWSRERWWLRDAHELGVGKYTSFGLGSVECSPLPDCASAHSSAAPIQVDHDPSPIARRRRVRLPRWVQLRGLPPGTPRGCAAR